MLSETELARREEGQLRLRPSAMRVSWRLPDATSQDGNLIQLTFGCAVRALDEPSERRLFEEVFLVRGHSVNEKELGAYFVPRLSSSAQAFVAHRPAEALLGVESTSLREQLADVARKAAFASGLDVLAPFELSVESTTIRQKTREKRQAHEQAERLAAASDLFKQFQSIRASAPELSASQVLSRISPTDQAQLLRALLLASAHDHGKALWMAAGNSLLSVDLAALESGSALTPVSMELPFSLGPLRSVQKGDGPLLAGARSGVWIVDTQRPAGAQSYADPETTSALGFSAAVLHGNRLWASHGEAGVVGWDLEHPEQPSIKLRPAAVAVAKFSPRHLTVLDESRLICASNGQLVIIHTDGAIETLEESAASGIISLLVSDDGLFSIHEDGLVRVRDRRTLELRSSGRRSGKLTAAGRLPWLGTQRFLLATAEGPVVCFGLDDELVTQYASAHRGLRMVAASSACVAAVSADRQRLVLWKSWDGREPATELHLGSIARHRIADMKAL